MANVLTLPANGSDEVSAIGDCIAVYRASGAVRAKIRRAGTNETYTWELQHGFTVRLPWTFDHFELTDQSGFTNEVEIYTGFGQLTVRGEGTVSTVDEILKPVVVQRIVEQITATIAETVTVAGTVSVDNLPANQTVTVDNLPAVQTVQQKTAGNMTVTEYEVPAGGSVVVPGLSGRKRLFLQADSDSATVIKARVSESAAVSIKGALLAVGAGFVGELDQAHEAAVKVWNPGADIINLVALEEF